MAGVTCEAGIEVVVARMCRRKQLACVEVLCRHLVVGAKGLVLAAQECLVLLLAESHEELGGVRGMHAWGRGGELTCMTAWMREQVGGG